MKILARTFSNNEDRISFIRSLICTENFSQYANKIEEAINRGDFYDWEHEIDICYGQSIH